MITAKCNGHNTFIDIKMSERFSESSTSLMGMRFDVRILKMCVYNILL